MRTLLLFVLVAGCGDNSENPRDAAVGDLKAADASADKPDLEEGRALRSGHADCATRPEMHAVHRRHHRPNPARSHLRRDTGAKADGETCTRVSLGDDDCEKGFCAPCVACRTAVRLAARCATRPRDCNPGEKCTGTSARRHRRHLRAELHAFSTTCGAGNTCGTSSPTSPLPTRRSTCSPAARPARRWSATPARMTSADPTCPADRPGCVYRAVRHTHTCSQPSSADGGTSPTTAVSRSPAAAHRHRRRLRR